jgi:hypothetical protein
MQVEKSEQKNATVIIPYNQSDIQKEEFINKIATGYNDESKA